MNDSLKLSLSGASFLVLFLAALQPATAQLPLYNDVKPPRRFSLTDLDKKDIRLPAAASTVDEANDGFAARTAAAVYQGTGADLKTLNGENYGLAVLARYAYIDYIEDGLGPLHRGIADLSLMDQKPGKIGSVDGGDYDMLLNLYITLVYKYNRELTDHVREHIINDLLTVRGPLGDHESECEACSAIATIPETENHLFMIETARYLTNQILYQRTHSPEFDNRRNGNDSQATAVWLLDQLRSRLRHDFDEYNARNYQDLIMMSLLNLSSYAYDDDVRLAARMVLDYISAKIAVSSNDLRRAPPFRRRNEDEHWGPNIPGLGPVFGPALFLRSPLLRARTYPDVPDPKLTYQPDPQGPWYALFAGNTRLLGDSAPGTPQPGNFTFAMILAGIHDYRVPNPILDLFLTPAHRLFYQRFHHFHTMRDALDEEFGDELYAGSPSYLITAGGHPTDFCYKGHVGPIFSGITADLGAAMPTTFMPSGSDKPTDADLTLDHMIQLGSYTDNITDNDPVKYHMGVAPDFACGSLLYIPEEIKKDPSVIINGRWTFIDRSHLGEQKPGYYLAIYSDPPFGLLEAFDTLLNAESLSFEQFRENIIRRHGSTRFTEDQENPYVTQSGQLIQFRIAPGSDIVSTNAEPEPTGYKDKFTHGTIINSEQGSGVETISNRFLPGKPTITLEMRDDFHPTRTSELGQVERAGFDVHEEVWVDFNSPASVPSGPDGDFYHPFKTLEEAQNTVTPGGTVMIVPGSKKGPIVLNRKMTLKSFFGSATIGRP